MSKTNVRDSSLVAYRELQSHLGKQERMILQAIINLGNPTRREIAEYLEMQASSVSGRVFGLMHPVDHRTGNELKPIVMENGKRKCKVSGKMTATLTIANVEAEPHPTYVIEHTGQVAMVL